MPNKMKTIAVVLILCILAVAIGYVVHQTHSTTEFQLGESGIVNKNEKDRNRF
jgi:cell division protein FtsL